MKEDGNSPKKYTRLELRQRASRFVRETCQVAMDTAPAAGVISMAVLSAVACVDGVLRVQSRKGLTDAIGEDKYTEEIFELSPDKSGTRAIWGALETFVGVEPLIQISRGITGDDENLQV